MKVCPTYLLQVEFDFRSKWFNQGWSVISLSLVFIIIKGDKEITNQPRLKSFWPQIKLTCNISTSSGKNSKWLQNIWQIPFCNANYILRISHFVSSCCYPDKDVRHTQPHEDGKAMYKYSSILILQTYT